MPALDHLAGVKQVFFFVTKDTAMALQALTAVGEGIDGQAGAVHASTVKEKQNNENQVDPGVQKVWWLGKTCLNREDRILMC